MGITQTDVDALLAAAEGLAAEAGPEPDQADVRPSPATPDPAAPPAGVPRPAGGAIPKDLQRILKLSVPVIVKLAGRQMPVGKVLDLKVGSIMEFDQVFDADLELIVANRLVGLGQAVKMGENFGLRVTQIGNIDQTIKALGGG